MATPRKIIAGRSDWCGIRVPDAIGIFNDALQNVGDATGPSQKNKGMDKLKKEYKKLKKLREQVNGWLAAGEFKDRSKLRLYRESLETHMNQFEVLEREMKTKKYSEKDLVASLQRDPTHIQINCKLWLMQTIDLLNLRANHLETKIKKSRSKEEQKIQLQSKFERTRSLVKQLEKVLQSVNKMCIDRLDNLQKLRQYFDQFSESSHVTAAPEDASFFDDINSLLTNIIIPESSSSAIQIEDGKIEDKIQSTLMTVTTNVSKTTDVNVKTAEETIGDSSTAPQTSILEQSLDEVNKVVEKSQPHAELSLSDRLDDLSKKYDEVIGLLKTSNANYHEVVQKLNHLNALIFLKEVGKDIKTTFERTIKDGELCGKLGIETFKEEDKVIDDFSDFLNVYATYIQEPRNKTVHDKDSIVNIDRKRIENSLDVLLVTVEDKQCF